MDNACIFCGTQALDSTFCEKCYVNIMTRNPRINRYQFFQSMQRYEISFYIRTDPFQMSRLKTIEKEIHCFENRHLNKMIAEYAVYRS